MPNPTRAQVTRLEWLERGIHALRARLDARRGELAALRQQAREAATGPGGRLTGRPRQRPHRIRVVGCRFGGTIGVPDQVLGIYRYYGGDFLETVTTDADGYARTDGEYVDGERAWGTGFAYQIVGYPAPVPPYDPPPDVYRYTGDVTVTHPAFTPGKICTNCTDHFEQVNRTTLRAYDRYGSTGLFTAAGAASHTGGGRTLTYKFAPESAPDTRFDPWRLGISGSGGTGAAGTGDISGTVVAVDITSTGALYSSGATISFAGGGGSGAAADPIYGYPLPGGTAGVNIINGGTGYTGAVSLRWDYGNAEIVGWDRPGGTFTSIFTRPGTNYRAGQPPNVIFDKPVGAPGSGAVAVGVIGTNPYNIQRAVVTAGGSGYTSTPTVIIDPPYAGAPVNQRARGVAVISAQVASVTLTSPGGGYMVGDRVSFFGGGGFGAIGLVSAVDGPGGITAVTIVNGYDYSSAPTVILTGGGGSGATATASVSGGEVTGFTVTNPGSGYVMAPSVSIVGGGGGLALGRAVISGGQVTAIILGRGGFDYTSNPTAVFNSTGGASYFATGRRLSCTPPVWQYDYTDNPFVAGRLLPADDAIVTVKA